MSGEQRWVCTDCICLFANGDTPPELDEAQTAAWLADVDQSTAGYEVCCGGEHEDDCPNMVDGEWQGTTDCSCETREFSSQRCGTCGGLPGARHAVTLFGVTDGTA